MSFLWKKCASLSEKTTPVQGRLAYSGTRTAILSYTKNKSDATRAVRYRGKDEAYAVNEIYQKLRSEVQNQRSRAPAKRNTGPDKSRGQKKKQDPRKRIFLTILIIFVVICIATYLNEGNNAKRGYYRYGSDYYYYQNDSWYLYDDVLLDWLPATVDQELELPPVK